MPLILLYVILAEDDYCTMAISKFKVRCLKQTADLLIELRKLLDVVLASKITEHSDPATRHSEFEEQVLT